jgi:hypothetical protein
MIQELKISKTKKRLSSHAANKTIVLLTLFGLCVVFGYLVRVLDLTWPIGTITMSLPIAASKDDEEQLASIGKVSRLQDDSMVVALVKHGILFGPLSAFTSQYLQKNGRYEIPHQDRRPNLQELVLTMERWRQTPNALQIDWTGPLLLIPDQQIPMPIVLQTIATLKRHAGFENIILSDGLL